MMKAIIKISLIALLVVNNSLVFAQKTVKEYVTKNSVEKIKKSIGMDAFTVPATNKSFKDGHGRNAYFATHKQLPDTIALITFHINDIGDSETTQIYINNWTTYWFVSEKGGNEIANEMQKQTLEGLKEEFKKRGAVLLTPSEFLDTPEKISYYNNEFTPEVSKMGKFLSNLENKKTDISVCADDYRYFDMGASFDYKRSMSLGGDLANKLGVDAVLGIGVLIQSTKKENAYIKMVKMSMHGPNPNPKVNKKYYGQKNGTGYYNGQLYLGGTFIFKKSIKSIEFDKKEIISMNFEGLEIVFNSFIERFYDEMDKAIAKVSK